MCVTLPLIKDCQFALRDLSQLFNGADSGKAPCAVRPKLLQAERISRTIWAVWPIWSLKRW